MDSFNTNSQNRLIYRPEIDGLRGLAVLLVVAFHAFPTVIRGGFIGVDIFFVISGFLISTIILTQLESEIFSFKGFFIRRVVRIFPALVCVLILSYAFGWFALLGDEYQQLGKHIAAGAGFGSNLLLWRESGYFDSIAETKPLLHLWSLGIEEQFYLIWPLILWLGWKVRFNIIAVTFLIALISFSLNIQAIHSDAVASFYSPQTRFWELLSGSLLAFFMLNGKHKKWESKVTIFFQQNLNAIVFNKKWVHEVLSLIGLGLILLGLTLISRDRFFPGWWALIPILGAVFIIYSGEQSRLNKLLFANSLMVWFGLISFPLYLCHWPILSFAQITQSGVPEYSIRVTAVLGSILTAWLLYRLIEKPIRMGANKGRKAVILIGALALIGAVGFFTYMQEGLIALRPHIQLYNNNKNELVRLPRVDNDCLAYIRNKKPLIPYCRFTNLGAKETVAVIGDSHAHVSYPGIAKQLSKHNINTVLLANSGCPPFLGGEYGSTEQEKNMCRDRIKQLIETVLTKKEIKKVFIFSRGPVYLTGTYFGDAKSSDLKEPLIDKTVFQRALQKSIDTLHEAGKTVYYVTENPELNHLPAACLDRPLRFNHKKCSVDLATVKMRQEQYLHMLEQLKNVTIISSIESFCPGTVCEPFYKGKLLYADFDHLSVAGSDFQAEKILKHYLS